MQSRCCCEWKHYGNVQLMAHVQLNRWQTKNHGCLFKLYLVNDNKRQKELFIKCWTILNNENCVYAGIITHWRKLLWPNGLIIIIEMYLQIMIFSLDRVVRENQFERQPQQQQPTLIISPPANYNYLHVG